MTGGISPRKMSTAPNQGLDRGAAQDLWRNTLSQIPSLFGRMVYLSSLRDTNSDRYEHHGLALRAGGEESDSALRASHSESFAGWLCLSIEAQKADLDLYLSALENDKRTIVEAWLLLKPYRNLPPGTARPAERELYLSDFEALLTLLKNEYGAAAPDPDA